MPNIWFTSDLHLGHANVIKHTNRPFRDVEEMDEEIIKRWNSEIKPKDTVYHLGDFSFHPARYLKRLNGELHIILGNHDPKPSKWKGYMLGNINYPPHPNIKSVQTTLEISPHGQFIFLSHYAHRVWPKSHFNTWHLYGHSHNTLEQWGKSMDVGVDGNDFYPYSWNEIRTAMDYCPDNPNLVDRNDRD